MKTDRTLLKKEWELLWVECFSKSVMRQLLGLLIIASNAKAIQYCYPIVTVDSQSLFFIYQNSLNDLELWRYFPEQHICQKALYWRFLPGGLKILPDRSGFSFIDSGRLRIKKFIKRSPRSVDFDQPIFGVNEISWWNNHQCYFSARQREHYAIFEGNINDGTIRLLYEAPSQECLSPVIIEQELFYIERHNLDRSSRICKISNPFLTSNTPKSVLIDCGYRQVIYLQMISNTLGFYIEHMPYIRDELPFVAFIIHHLELVGEKWQDKMLAKFQIPKQYLFGEERVYESLIPFLPRVDKNIIYYVDIKQTDLGKPFSSLSYYDLVNNQHDCLLNSPPGEVYFAPLRWQDKLFYGKIMELESLVNKDPLLIIENSIFNI